MEDSTNSLSSSDSAPDPIERRWSIEVIEGPDAGKRTIAERASIVAGSHSTADLILSDDTVSRHHAQLAPRSDGVLVIDLGSHNGTRVGREKIERALVTSGG